MSDGFESVPIVYSRRGLALHRWVNDKVPGSDEVVLTDATLVFNLTEGLQVLITNLTFDHRLRRLSHELGEL